MKTNTALTVAALLTFIILICSCRPMNAEACLNRGLSYEEAGLIDKAIQDFTKAIELNNKYADAYYFRGYAYDENGASDKAITDFRQYLQLNPNSEFRDKILKKIADLKKK